MRITSILTVAAFGLTAYAVPAAAESSADPSSLSACGEDKDGDSARKRKRRGEKSFGVAPLSACGEDKDGDSARKRKRRGEKS